ncbi:MAG TPA: carboxymuconolactone decarboxylase family protein [Pseudonocardia sp.]|uniref:carboxymuconolactone decarboxylase family protein n=1 Tax=Pseudonocardia sp. TaxID=60912 RepID=UPI002C5F9FB4|nr:carboxymuconolactone decarboxylase family protein [Pseudonocardia sp.]HTF49338.1 carboxymuconolactone decarboxylase family protein [Pseudonocardia sp.]
MTERMHMEKVIPGAYKAVLGLEKYCVANVDPTVLELVKLRASMVNGCAFCVNMHSHDATAAGESPERLFQVAAWHDAVCFTPRERAALALTDAVTKLGEHGVPDEVWNEARAWWSEEEVANLIVAIATINVWNRISITTRRAPQSYATATA